MSELCEFNPKITKASYGGHVDGDCTNEATVCLGSRPSWHLCDSCAALPFFSRFRTRAPLRHPPTPDSG